MIVNVSQSETTEINRINFDFCNLAFEKKDLEHTLSKSYCITKEILI